MAFRQSCTQNVVKLLIVITLANDSISKVRYFKYKTSQNTKVAKVFYSENGIVAKVKISGNSLFTSGTSEKHNFQRRISDKYLTNMKFYSTHGKPI